MIPTRHVGRDSVQRGVGHGALSRMPQVTLPNVQELMLGPRFRMIEIVSQLHVHASIPEPMLSNRTHT